jgi:hypothetical protein
MMEQRAQITLLTAQIKRRERVYIKTIAQERGVQYVIKKTLQRNEL